MNKKFVYQVVNNKKVILWCMANQISIKCCCQRKWRHLVSWTGKWTWLQLDKIIMSVNQQFVSWRKMWEKFTESVKAIALSSANIPDVSCRDRFLDKMKMKKTALCVWLRWSWRLSWHNSRRCVKICRRRQSKWNSPCRRRQSKWNSPFFFTKSLFPLCHAM